MNPQLAAYELRANLMSRLYQASLVVRGRPFAVRKRRIEWEAMADECIRQMEWVRHERMHTDVALLRTRAEFPNMHGTSGRDKVCGMREGMEAITQHHTELTLAPEGWKP